MSNVLFLTSSIGPAEGAVYSSLKRSGHHVQSYNISGQWIPRTASVPLWMRGYRSRLSPMARNWFARMINLESIDVVVSSGLEAASFAARNLDKEYYPLLWRGDLDFPERNATLTEAFSDLVRTSDRLLLEDSWEMDKAVSKNSQIAHLQMRYPKPPRQSYLTSVSDRAVILYPPSDTSTARILSESAKEALGSAVDVETLDIDTLYSTKDLAKQVDFYDALTHRLKDYSHAIILGSGPHHSTVIRALSQDIDRIVVDQSVGMALLNQDIELPHRARGARCVQVLKRLIESPETYNPSELRSPEESESRDFLESLKELWSCDYQSWFEELPSVTSDAPLDVFFSVGALQDLRTGARPQRIRNMHDVFTQKNALNIFGAERFLSRRIHLANELLKKGRSAGIFYGENSTTPMRQNLSDALSAFLEKFTHLGGRSLWFVRDLHWLETFRERRWSVQRGAELKIEGLYELHKVGDKVDLLAAPSAESGAGFNELLISAGENPRNWVALPPAVEPQNIIDEEELVDSAGLTVLYTGGISDIYGMDLYLAALLEINDNVKIDFVVREAESERLRAALDRIGLLESDRTRLLHTSMDLYRSRTSHTLGMILLDSKYAKFSFPYKTVTMIERGYPILCYSDMAIADFVTSNELGLAVDRTTVSIRDGIETLASKGAPGIPRIRQTETWENRVKRVYELLDTTF